MGGGFRHADLPSEVEKLAAGLVDAVAEVRRELGAGLLESVYQEALALELRAREVEFEAKPALPIAYKGRLLAKCFYPDFAVGDSIILEAKAVEEVHPAHFAQLLTYLRLSERPLGFLVNFHAVPLRAGIFRRVRTRPRDEA